MSVTTSDTGFDVDEVRSRFPALQRHLEGRPVVYFDGPGGSQTPRSVIRAISHVLERGISNLGGPFSASVEADHLVTEARLAGADLLNVPDGGQVAFGPSMTALTLIAAEALSRDWGPEDEVVLTRLDHDANVSPWLFAAERTGATVRWVDFDPDDGCRLASVEDMVTPRTRLVAITHASNAVGTIPDVATACAAARSVGAVTYVDAVHYAAHDVVDMTALDADFVACSAYKFCGPHVGLLAIGPRMVDEVGPIHIRPVKNRDPDQWERGTLPFELLAGVTAAVDYLASLGDGATRRHRLTSGIGRAHAATTRLTTRFFEELDQLDHVTVFGPGRDEPRTSTVALEAEGLHPAEVAGRLGNAGIFTWPGHYYALEVMRRLGKLDDGGLTRIGFMHYNTIGEVERLVEALDAMAR